MNRDIEEYRMNSGMVHELNDYIIACERKCLRIHNLSCII